MRWDPARYASFSDLRDRPFFDLVGRTGAVAPRTVVDLGCGTGNLTASLAERWPGARVIGIDSSAEMLARAGEWTERYPNLRFEEGDIASWQPGSDVDVVVSNAAFQWVPDHDRMIATWLDRLPPSAWLGFQVPGNFSAPSHRIMREIASSDRWRAKVGDVLRHDDAVLEPIAYAEIALDHGWEVDAWETTYEQLLPGKNAVLNWTRGTGLRPVLARLDEKETADFEKAYAEALDLAYPPTHRGTWFPFRRIFCVARRPAET